ncbi:phosphate/phosphite/phosphonate ABC transporter substrate-binding protein [Sulfitobacter sp.]|uniref:phosphate/phosphite/phosphonate ABC transporter substrate-binding protein n=1 Tax=Sulfitobacter sp. TaxID=1903071 RepID=UPI003001DCDE
MIASLMMYARPELDAALTTYWHFIRARLAAEGIEAPETLAQGAAEFDVWEDPALVLSQTCGMPYRTKLHRSVQLVGTPDYSLDGLLPGYYRSAIVVPADDPRVDIEAYATARLAFNMADSQSGFAAIYAHTKAAGFWFTDRVQSGGHVNSARMVAHGTADIASIDAQTWRLIQRYEPWPTQLRVLEYTTPTPGLPYITGPQHDANTVFGAVSGAIADLSAEDRSMLDLNGLVAIPQSAYIAVQNPPVEALL